MKRKSGTTGVVMAALLAAVAMLMLPIAAPAAKLEASGGTSAPITLQLPGGAIPEAEPQAAGISLILDDGTVENNIGTGGTIEMLFVNRFTPDPASFPFEIDEISVWFSTDGLVSVGDDITLILFENIAGSADPAVGANLLASFDTTVQAVDTWNVYSLPTPVSFNGPGDAIIGVIALELPGFSYFPAAFDQTASQGRSWVGYYTTSPPPSPPTLPTTAFWSLIDNAGFPGNWMIRASGQGSLCPAGPEVGELTSETPVFNRPAGFGGSCGLSSVGTAVHYDVYSYYLGSPAPHDLFASTIDGSAMDTVLVFYQAPDGSANPFDPTQGCLNTVAYNDDFGGSLQSQISATDLAAGWVDVVITTFSNETTGTYTMEVESDSCQATSSPNIDVDPLSLSSIQPIDTITGQTLDIINTGSADLVWEIFEAPAGAAVSFSSPCDNPVDIPWLSVDTDNGTTAPGETTPVDVTFDSTGLAVGTYSANLCIFSNDPDNGTGNGTELVIVPVDLEVVEECVTDDDCAGETPVCDLGSNVCVQCVSDWDCAEGWSCEENVCRSPCELIVQHKRIRSDKLTKPRRVVLRITSLDEFFDIYGLIDVEPFTWQRVRFNQRKNLLRIRTIVPAGLAPGVYSISVGDCFGEVVVE